MIISYLFWKKKKKIFGHQNFDYYGKKSMKKQNKTKTDITINKTHTHNQQKNR